MKILLLCFLLVVVATSGYYVYRGTDVDVADEKGTVITLMPDPDSAFWQSDPEKKQKIILSCFRVIQKRLGSIEEAQGSTAEIRGNFIELVLSPSADAQVLSRILTTDQFVVYLLSDIKNDSNPGGHWRLQSSVDSPGRYDFYGQDGTSIDSKDNSDQFFSKIIGGKTPVLTAKDFLTGAKLLTDSEFDVLEVRLKKAATVRLSALTADNIGSYLAFCSGGRLLAVPEISRRLSGDTLQVTGLPGTAEAQRLVELISSGALPVKLVQVTRIR